MGAKTADALGDASGVATTGGGAEPGAASGDAPKRACALGIGGYPRGRVVEMFGPESSGKTTLALTAIAQVQASGGVSALTDVQAVAALGVSGAILGRALLEGRFTLGEALAC